MPTDQANITLGTAGHIDHGKTVLIKCLTGCDTDTLKEEKERGMSIDLGFAPCTIANSEVGIVDVPGHENFVKTMVAGASGMDGVIFVVAADDGVMPQTREHLDILTLLGIRHGIVALTKIDRVTPDQLHCVRAEIKDFLNGTFLDTAAILPVCGLTGEGFGPFLEALNNLVASIKPKPTDGLFRLPVDRSFSVKGYGTVVTGIPVSGAAKTGDEIVLLPHDITGRIKAIQVYKKNADRVLAGQCAAVNVRHWDHRTITRGNTVTVPGYFAPSRWYLCKLRLLGHEKLTLKNSASVKFHTGTSETLATIYLMQTDRLTAGQESLVQIRLSDALIAGPGDPFILRTFSPVQTIGGGRIIEAIPKKLKRNQPGLIEDLTNRADAVLDESRFAEYCLKNAPSFAARLADLSTRTKLPAPRLQIIVACLIEQAKLTDLAAGLYIHQATIERLTRQILDILRDFQKNPPKAQASPSTGSKHPRKSPSTSSSPYLPCSPKQAPSLKDINASRFPNITKPSAPKTANSWSALKPFPKPALPSPGPGDLVKHIKAPKQKIDDAIKTLIEHERLIPVESDLLFHAHAVASARQIIVDFIRKASAAMYSWLRGISARGMHRAATMSAASMILRATYPRANASSCFLRIGNIMTAMPRTEMPLSSSRRTPSATWVSCAATLSRVSGGAMRSSNQRPPTRLVTMAMRKNAPTILAVLL